MDVYGKNLTSADMDGVFFYMCFFVNNQFRIMVENSVAGSTNLEDVFEINLTRIGRMIAILDTWEEPVYLTRVWTVFEQFKASELEIPATCAASSAVKFAKTPRRRNTHPFNSPFRTINKVEIVAEPRPGMISESPDLEL